MRSYVTTERTNERTNGRADRQMACGLRVKGAVGKEWGWERGSWCLEIEWEMSHAYGEYKASLEEGVEQRWCVLVCAIERRIAIRMRTYITLRIHTHAHNCRGGVRTCTCMYIPTYVLESHTHLFACSYLSAHVSVRACAIYVYGVARLVAEHPTVGSWRANENTCTLR